MSKPYHQIPIHDCGEPLVPIPSGFQCVQPHPYAQLGAPYEDKSPFWVRQEVGDRLILAQAYLQAHHPNWQILIFDAFRPLAVQQFMVNYTFTQLMQQQGFDEATLTPTQQQALLTQVHEFWAIPDPDPASPPPHSTGGAVDVTLSNRTGQIVEMGSDIDELSPRSYPNHYAKSKSEAECTWHQHREVLHHAMTQAGFKRHPNEWWHFCYGDQMWAWLMQAQEANCAPLARYGRVT